MTAIAKNSRNKILALKSISLPEAMCKKYWLCSRAGSGIDLFMGWINILEYISRNTLLKLNPYMEKYQFPIKEYYPVAFENCKFNDNIYALPCSVKNNLYSIQ